MSGPTLRVFAERGDDEGLSNTLAGGANPCSKDKYGLTALHIAVWNGHLECIKVLCANNMGVNEDETISKRDVSKMVSIVFAASAYV